MTLSGYLPCLCLLDELLSSCHHNTCSLDSIPLGMFFLSGCVQQFDMPSSPFSPLTCNSGTQLIQLCEARTIRKHHNRALMRELRLLCRADTLRRAIMERLLPSFAVELRSKLLAEAQEAVLLQVSDKLWDWASQAPTQVSPCTKVLVDDRVLGREREPPYTYAQHGGTSCVEVWECTELMPCP